MEKATPFQDVQFDPQGQHLTWVQSPLPSSKTEKKAKVPRWGPGPTASSISLKGL